MAKLTDDKAVVNNTENVENTTVNVDTTDEWEVVANRITLEDILQRMDKLERENAELREGKMNVFTEWKKFYDWPRKFCYKMWGWVPVLSYKSFKKDPTKDLMYKNQFGAWVSNHYLKLSLANGKDAEVEVNEFNRDYTLSEKEFAEKATDNRGNVLGYTFKTEEWGEFIVAQNILNE